MSSSNSKGKKKKEDTLKLTRREFLKLAGTTTLTSFIAYTGLRHIVEALTFTPPSPRQLSETTPVSAEFAPPTVGPSVKPESIIGPYTPVSIGDAIVIKEGNEVVVLYGIDKRVLAKRKCLGQAIIDCLEWLIDKKAETGDKIVRIVLGPYKFYVKEQPIIVIDLFKKFNSWPEYYETGIAIIGSEPATSILCQEGLPTFLTIRNSTVQMLYMNNNVYIDNLLVKLDNGDCVIDIVNTATLWIGKLTILARGSKIGFRAIHTGAGDHRSLIEILRVEGAEVNVIINWDFRYILSITSLQARRHFVILSGVNYCGFLHTWGEEENMPPPIVLRGSNTVNIIRRETTYLAKNEYIYGDITNETGTGVSLFCSELMSNVDWKEKGKQLIGGNVGYLGTIYIKHVTSGKQYIGTIIRRGLGIAGPYGLLDIDGKSVLEIDRGGIAYAIPVFQIGGTPVSVPAGGSSTIAQLTVPSGKKLIISGIVEVFDPDGCISAKVYNNTDNITIAEVDGENWDIYEIPEGKEVSFMLKNSDSTSPHSGAYIFRCSIL